MLVIGSMKFLMIILPKYDHKRRKISSMSRYKHDNLQNEPEPVEECLSNSDKLSEEVVERLKEETAR